MSFVNVKKGNDIILGINFRSRMIFFLSRAEPEMPGSRAERWPCGIGGFDPIEGPFVYTGIGGWNSSRWNNKSIYY